MINEKVNLPNAHIPRRHCAPECINCSKVYMLGDTIEECVCIAYVSPKIRWEKQGGCALHSKKIIDPATEEKKKFVNPAGKWSKRKNRT